MSRPAGPGAAERGAGTVIALTLVVAVLGLAMLLAPIGTAAVGRHRALVAAESAALAAADVVVGFVDAVPCESAAAIARAAAARLDACRVDGFVVTVQVSVLAGPLRVAAVATAGPP